MIKANELRIGNWVMVKTSNDAGFYRVSGIDGWMRVFESKEDERIYNLTLDKQIKSKKVAKYNDERLIRIIDGARDKELFIESKLKPIPLTHDILLKCGFVKDDFNEWYQFYSKDDLMVAIHKTQDSIFVNWCGWQVDCYLNKFYLHQLQNLYFALTNTELNIQL